MNSPRQKQPFPILAAVFIGIAIWASLIAAGVFSKSDGNWGKTSIVIAVAVIFLGGWSLMLKRK